MSNENTTICYISNVNSKIYTSNTNSKFTTQLDEKLLHYVPKCKNLFVALKSISFASLKSSENLSTDTNAEKKCVIGVRSNITSEAIFCSSNCDKIFSIFHISDWKKDRITVEIENPIFYQSTFEHIANPQFELIELISNSTLVEIDSIKSIPTIIEISITIRSEDPSINAPFQMVLMSNDNESKQIFEENNNQNFTIQLNQRIQFDRQWTLTLKSFLMASHIYNIQTEDFIYVYSFTENKTGKNREVIVTDYINCGRYTTKIDIINHLNEKMKRDEIPLTFFISEGKCGIETSENFDNKRARLKLYPNLANLLGYTKNIEDGLVLHLSSKLTYFGSHPINVNYGLPKALLVNCDLVNKTEVGGNPRPMLSLIYMNENDFKNEVVHFTFRQNTYAIIGTNYFESIKFYITDLMGNIVKAENNHPTILHLLFVNV